jgi:small subunit ribosomal protein SAe
MEVDSDSDWLVQVDLFFYREPDETKDREEEEGGIAEFVPVE